MTYGQIILGSVLKTTRPASKTKNLSKSEEQKHDLF